MRGLKWIICLMAAQALAGCALSPRLEEAHQGVNVAVLKSGPDWTAEYVFDRDAGAWAFDRSALTRVGEKPWRPQSWTVLTPGVRLERRGWHDVLVSGSGPVPRKVKIGFTPFPGDLLADYDPALIFTDGSVALFSEHFNVFPLTSVSAADALPMDLTGIEIEEAPTTVTFRDSRGTVLHSAGRSKQVSLMKGETYVLFGPAQPIETKDIATIVDPQLPEWLSRDLAQSTTKLLSFYADHLGQRAGSRPMLMVSWAGPALGVRSMGGSVLPGLVVMTFEGDRLLRDDPETLASARRFVGHESAHFWLGQTITYASPREAWITEGGSDLLSIRAAAALDTANAPTSALQDLADDCVKLAAGKPISSAGERNEQRAYYACGAMFGLAAEAAAKRAGGDFFSFWRILIDANRADGIVTQDEWLDELTRLSGDPLIAEQIRNMTDVGVLDPAKSLSALFTRAQVPHTLDAEGKLRLQ